LHVRKRYGDRGPRVRLVRRAAETAADQEIEACETAVVARMGNQSQVVRVDVDAVVAGNGDRRLELARQVLVAVERVGRVGLIRRRELAVEPDLAVSARGRGEPGDKRGQCLDRKSTRLNSSHH
jgi:hypothetical protein